MQNHLFNGETYNASAEQPGWAAPAFSHPTGHAWVPVTVMQPNISLLSGWDDKITIAEDRVPVNVTAGPGMPVVAGGEFMKSDTDVDIVRSIARPRRQQPESYTPHPLPPPVSLKWWVANGTSSKHHVDECSPCAGVDACSTFVTVPQSYLDGLTTGANFTCAMLPLGNASSYVFDMGRNMAGFCSLEVPAAAAGTQFALVHGEILTPGGAVDNTYGTSSPTRQCGVNQGNCADQLDLYYSAGLPGTYTPTFTFHGFRYVRWRAGCGCAPCDWPLCSAPFQVGLFGWPTSSPPPTVENLTCHVVSTEMSAAGGVTTNSTVLNAIQAAIVASASSGGCADPLTCATRTAASVECSSTLQHVFAPERLPYSRETRLARRRAGIRRGGAAQPRRDRAL